jgi:hypothetical protein
MKRLLLVVATCIAICTQIHAQPTVLGTQLANGSYTTYDLALRGAVRAVKINATSGASSGARNWEFATGTAASTNYSTNWRPYTSSQTLSGYNAQIDPASAAASARYNTSFGGASGLLPAVTNGNYYTVIVGQNATANNFMSILQTSFNPVSISSVTRDFTTPTNQQAPTVTANLSGSLSSGEYIFIRYWTNASNSGSSNASLATMSGSGSTYTFQLPAIPANQTMSYYVFTTNNAAPSNSTVDYFTLNLNNNSNSNYTYTASGTTAFSMKFIDGTTSDWTSSDLISNDGSRNAYLTWDDQYFYIRISGGFGDADRINVGFDTNPGTNLSSATNDFSGANFTGDLTPDYLVQSTSPSVLNLYTRSSNSWGSSSSIYASGAGLFRSGSEAEFRVARSAISLSSTSLAFGFYVWLSNSSDEMYSGFGTGNYPSSYSATARRMRSAYMFSGAATNVTPSSAVVQDYNASEISHTISGSGYRNLYVSANTASTASGSATSITGDLLIETVGTLSAGNTLTIGGNVTLTGSGELALNGKTVNVTGSFSGSGVVNATNASTLVVNGTGSGGTVNFKTGAQTLGTLTLNRSTSGTLVLGTNLTLTTLNLTNGTLSTSGTLTVASNGGINRIAGSFSGTPSFAGNVDVTYSNTSSISSGNELPSGGTIRNLTISNSADVSLTQSLTLTGSLTLNAGKLDLGTNSLTVNASSVGAGSSTSYIKTSSSGSLIVKNVTNSATTIPVGNNTYNPLSIASGSGNTLDWTVRVVDGAPTANAGYNANGAVSRTWNITPSTVPVPGDGATITFRYDGGSNVGGSFNNSTSTAMQAWHLSGSQWVKAGQPAFPVQVSGSERTFTVAGLTWFSPYGLGNVGAPLPVSMLSFTGKRANNINELKWITASESNNRGFGIERSADGVSFTQVAFVNSRATAGNSTVDIQYTFNDPSTGAGGQTAGKWYYRLKQTDLDGRYKYSQVVLIKADKSGLLTIDGIFPNPVKGAAQVRVQAGTQGGTVVLQLSDMTGRIVKTQNVRAEAGSSTTVTMNLEGLAAGQYHMKAVQADGSMSETVMVVKQ